MGLTVFIFGVAVILIVTLLLVSVLSPDNWAQASAGSNQTCCASCGTSCSGGSGNSSSFPGGGGGGGSKDRAVILDEQKVQNFRAAYDPYAQLDDVPLWQKYTAAKEKAQKEKFLSQQTYVVTPKNLQVKFQKFLYHPRKKSHDTRADRRASATQSSCSRC